MCGPTFWRFWLWFRLLTGNRPCIGFSIVSAIASFVIPVTWVFSFIPVCRAAQIAGADGYGSQLGVIVAYSVICIVVWVCIFSTCCSTFLLALEVPGNGCCEDTTRRDEWIESQRPVVVTLVSDETSIDPPPTYTPDTNVGEYVPCTMKSEAPREIAHVQTLEERPWFPDPWTCSDVVFCTSLVYFIATGIVFPFAFLGIIPVIILHTTSYGAAFGYGCAAVGIYVGGVVLIYLAPWIAYGSGLVTYWAGSTLNEYLCGSYRAAFAPDGFGAVPDV